MISFSSISINYVVSFDSSSESLIFNGQLDAAKAFKENGVGEHWISDTQQNYKFSVELKRSEDIELSLQGNSLDINGWLTIQRDFSSRGQGFAELSSAQFDRVLMLMKGDAFSMSFTAKLEGLNLKQKNDDAFECKFLLKTSAISFKSVH